jgi:alanine dehydrogenase
MRIGILKEIKADEYRVGLVPESVKALTGRGHEVFVELSAGEGAGIADAEYAGVGARIVASADEIFTSAELIVKVKEPLAVERGKLRREQALFTYLHLAADPDQADDLIRSGVTAIAYETVTNAAGGLPLLAPMSRVAGRMAAQVAAHFLERPHGGPGILLGAANGEHGAEVVVLGGGVVGSNAALMAAAMGATVTVTAKSKRTLAKLANECGGRIRVLPAPEDATDLCRSADVVIGAALVAGGSAPKLISRNAVKQMKPRALIVDVSIDQGGCAETSRPTTHSLPTFVVDNVVHYCVANMPGAVPRTSTFALDRATRAFVLTLADQGIKNALIADLQLRNGLNIYDGHVTCRAVADALNLTYTPALDALQH